MSERISDANFLARFSLKSFRPELLALARQMLGLESEPEPPEEVELLQGNSPEA